ncbi:hypothetical protein LOD99_14296 [Oopsacas minuta]|uniref:BTB domain-containing protein n=1 Tax=Oopsacas minuta TaxID=111878 RepID=A0AAV7KFW0_9METZ|nr:hypothetical protein LOD99_14296 [Oopsacas minuta]
MKKSKSKAKPRGGNKTKNFFPVKTTNIKTGADQDLQLALALSISVLPKESQEQEDKCSAQRQEVEVHELKSKRKRVVLDKMEVPTLLVTTENDYKASVMRRAHNVLDVSSSEVCSENFSSAIPANHSFWSLASLSRITDSEDFLINKFKQVDIAATPVTNSELKPEPFNLIYKTEPSIFSSNFSKFLFNPFLSDTIIITKDSYKIPSHLFILAANSSLIRELISERYNMKRITMQGHEIHAVIPLLEFMYLGKFEFESSYLESIKKLACVLQMDIFFECLAEHERISNPAKENCTNFVEVENEIINICSQDMQTIKSPKNSIPNLFLKAKKEVQL